MLDCQEYTSKVCGSNVDVHIFGSFAPDEKTAEQKLSKIFDIANTSSNPQCNNSATEFFCKAAYRTCNYTDTNLTNLTFDCVSLQEDVCSDRWRELESISPTLTCCNSYSFDPVCPDQFANFCGVCSPLCHKFSQFGEKTTVAIDVLIGITTVISLIFGIIVFVCAYFKRKTM